MCTNVVFNPAAAGYVEAADDLAAPPQWRRTAASWSGEHAGNGRLSMTTYLETPADLLVRVGQDLGTTDWMKITQQQVDLFADATGDHQWIHTDLARAAKGPFKSTIAHGYLTLGPTSVVIGQVLKIRVLTAALNCGTELWSRPGAIPGTGAGRFADLRRREPRTRAAEDPRRGSGVRPDLRDRRSEMPGVRSRRDRAVSVTAAEYAKMTVQRLVPVLGQQIRVDVRR